MLVANFGFFFVYSITGWHIVIDTCVLRGRQGEGGGGIRYQSRVRGTRYVSTCLMVCAYAIREYLLGDFDMVGGREPGRAGRGGETMLASYYFIMLLIGTLKNYGCAGRPALETN